MESSQGDGKPVEFLWVNKTVPSTSLSHSESQERRRIFKHVQQWSKQQPKSPARARKLAAKKEEQSSERRAQSKLGQTTAAPHHPSSRAPVLNNRYRGRDIKDEPDSDQCKQHHVAIWPVPVKGTSMDPFRSTVANDAQIHTLLQYYLSVIGPMTFYVESGPEQVKSSLWTPDSVKNVQECVANDVHLYSLCASMAARLENMEQCDLGGDTSSTYMAKALIGLRNYIDSKPAIEERLIRDMFALACAEVYRGNHTATMIHLRGARTMVEHLGGLRHISRHLLETLVVGDLLFAAEQLSEPIFAMEWDAGPKPQVISGTKPINSSLRLLGQALRSPEHWDIINEDMRTTIAELIGCLKVAYYSWQIPDPDPRDLRWVFLKNMELRHRLLSLKVGDMRSEAVRIALIAVIMLLMTPMGGRWSVKKMIPHLQKLLLCADILGTLWQHHLGLLLWVLVVGAIAARGTSCHKWFATQLAGVVKTFDLEVDPEMIDLLEKYSLVQQDAFSIPRLNDRAIKIADIAFLLLAALECPGRSTAVSPGEKRGGVD